MTRTTESNQPLLALAPAAMGPLAAISALASSKASNELASWKAHEPVPQSLRALLPAYLGDLDEVLAPATDKQLAVAVARLLEYAVLFGVKIQDTASTAQIYAETLAVLPAPLLETAIARIKKGHKFNTLPRPADVLAQVSDEFHSLGLQRSRADWALKQAQRQRLAVGPAALSEASPASGPQKFSEETERMLAEMKARQRARRGGSADWKAEPPPTVAPRPDLTAKWARELLGPDVDAPASGPGGP